jgi:hypothetical protein
VVSSPIFASHSIFSPPPSPYRSHFLIQSLARLNYQKTWKIEENLEKSWNKLLNQKTSSFPYWMRKTTEGHTKKVKRQKVMNTGEGHACQILGSTTQKSVTLVRLFRGGGGSGGTKEERSPCCVSLTFFLAQST